MVLSQNLIHVTQIWSDSSLQFKFYKLYFNASELDLSANQMTFTPKSNL